MELLENLPPPVALALTLLAIVWIVLLFLLPFMVENIRGWTRRMHDELEDMNEKLDRLNQLLSARVAPGARPGPPREPPVERAEPPGPKVRKEPTISDLPPLEPTRRPPPNPVIRR